MGNGVKVGSENPIAWKTRIAWRILDLEDLDSLEDHSLKDTWSTWRSSENPRYLEEDLEYHLTIAPADHLKTWKT